MNTIDKFLTNSSKANPHKLALIDNESKFTYLELEEKVNKFSTYLNQFQELIQNLKSLKIFLTIDSKLFLP